MRWATGALTARSRSLNGPGASLIPLIFGPSPRSFYKEFSGLREDFGSMIQGIPSESDRLLYASVLLNRLMFIYFLQKKGFIQEE